jgi:hypothetical protein
LIDAVYVLLGRPDFLHGDPADNWHSVLGLSWNF